VRVQGWRLIVRETPGEWGPAMGGLEDGVVDELQAWAEDCVLTGGVELPEGRLSDIVNHLDLLQFRPARVEALEDGRVLELDELEVERRDLHVMRVTGRAGDPERRLRTVREKVVMEVGPFRVRGNLHRAPNAAPLAAVHRWTRFIPVTEAEFSLSDTDHAWQDATILVNRDLIGKVELVEDVPAAAEEPWPNELVEPVAPSGVAS
jgi:hypothetical protein